MLKDYNEIFQFAELAAEKCLEYLQTSIIKVEVELNTRRDTKINIDKILNDQIHLILNKTDIPILSEENKKKSFLNGLQWIIDPLDGSINYLRGLPVYAISIALWDNYNPIHGIIVDITNGKIYKSSDANSRSFQISTSKLKESILATGIPSSVKKFDKHKIDQLGIFCNEFKKIRMLGSASMSLYYVYKGVFDAYYEDGIYIWDVASGLCFINQTGGKFEIEIYDNLTCRVIASNKNIFHQFKKLLK